MDSNNTIVVEDDSQYTVGENFENDVLFEIDMNQSTQMGNVKETEQNELLTTSQNS